MGESSDRARRDADDGFREGGWLQELALNQEREIDEVLHSGSGAFVGVEARASVGLLGGVAGEINGAYVEGGATEDRANRESFEIASRLGGRSDDVDGRGREGAPVHVDVDYHPPSRWQFVLDAHLSWRSLGESATIAKVLI
ncbi:MAG: hypothetical protein WAV45_02020 [Propionibacteriaceae bacterium]